MDQPKGLTDRSTCEHIIICVLALTVGTVWNNIKAKVVVMLQEEKKRKTQAAYASSLEARLNQISAYYNENILGPMPSAQCALMPEPVPPHVRANARPLAHRPSGGGMGRAGVVRGPLGTEGYVVLGRVRHGWQDARLGGVAARHAHGRLNCPCMLVSTSPCLTFRITVRTRVGMTDVVSTLTNICNRGVLSQKMPKGTRPSHK